MSNKISEYLKLIPKAFKDPEKILEGWTNAISVQLKSIGIDVIPDEDMKIILERRAICEECPYNSEKAKTSDEYKKLYGKNYETSRTDPHCSICSCPLFSKCASLTSDCGLDAYNMQNLSNKQPLKWKAKQNGNK